MSNDNTKNNNEILALKENLSQILCNEHGLTKLEVEKIINYINFDCPYVLEVMDNPKNLEFFLTLEYVQDFVYISPSELRNSYYGISAYPGIGVGDYIKVAKQEKIEETITVRDSKKDFKFGKVNIIEDVKDLAKRAEFDPWGDYIIVKKVIHRVTSIFSSEYCAYVIMVYTPNKRKVGKYLKVKNTLKKFKK